MEINKVGVVGGGQMGGGIAQAVATAGLEVSLVEVKDELIKKAMEGISWGLDKFIKKGKLLPEQKEEIVKRIRCTLRLEDLKDMDLVIEAVPEKEALKSEIFRRLEALCPPRVIFATNTSSISITKLASATRRPERFIGIHFMNPAPVMELVELIMGMNTSEETLETARNFCRCLGKTPVEVKDSPGFVVNRIMAPMINEAVYLLMEGVASLEDIDRAMTLGARHPMGPLALADFVGLDT
ncbi:MAG TPA: 3-hydroxyacyl-CoA dehydrogenase family protein, partial [Candidatus Hypogeohydataceae bacterium YC38]